MPVSGAELLTHVAVKHFKQKRGAVQSKRLATLRADQISLSGEERAIEAKRPSLVYALLQHLFYDVEVLS